MLAIPRGPWHESAKEMPRYRVNIRVLVNRPRRTQDPTNVRASAKYMEDALVAHGWAVDDTGEWLDFDIREKVGKRKTRIRWEVEL